MCDVLSLLVLHLIEGAIILLEQQSVHVVELSCLETIEHSESQIESRLQHQEREALPVAFDCNHERAYFVPCLTQIADIRAHLLPILVVLFGVTSKTIGRSSSFLSSYFGSRSAAEISAETEWSVVILVIGLLWSFLLFFSVALYDTCFGLRLLIFFF